MAFLLFILVNATLFIRPGDILPALEGVPIYLALISACSLSAFPEIWKQFSNRSLKFQPITICVIGILAAVIMSHISNMYLSGMVFGGLLFFKIVIYYTLLVVLINTPEKFRQFLLSIVVCSSAMILLCVSDYLEIVDLPTITPIVENWGELATGDLGRMTRMRGVGIFSDPNDLSLLIVATSILSLYFFNDRQQGNVRYIWFLPIILMGIALICTHSRGGLLSAASASFIWFTIRYGKKPAIVVAVLGICLIPVVLGRQGNIDLSDGTAQQRIQLWSDGLSAIQSPRILFGIGEGFYEDWAGLVAHNSFVHAYVELGFFGGTFFFGCFFFAALGMYRVIRTDERIHHPELRRLKPYMMAMLAGWSVGLMSLSRCYVAPTYMVLGCVSVYMNLAALHLRPRRSFVIWNAKHCSRLIASSSLALVFCMLFVRLFARWG